MALTPEDVRNKAFSTAKRRKDGYDPDEVDQFLDLVEVELASLLRQNADLKGRLAAAEVSAASAPPPPPQLPTPVPVAVPAAVPVAAPPPQEQAVRMLELAQKTADAHISSAKAEADKLLVDARERAGAAVREAETNRTSLERRVDDLRAFEREYRSRLRQQLEGLLRDLGHRTEAGTGQSSPGQPLGQGLPGLAPLQSTGAPSPVAAPPLAAAPNPGAAPPSVPAAAPGSPLISSPPPAAPPAPPAPLSPPLSAPQSAPVVPPPVVPPLPPPAPTLPPLATLPPPPERSPYDLPAEGSPPEQA